MDRQTERREGGIEGRDRREGGEGRMRDEGEEGPAAYNGRAFLFGRW